MKPIIVANWKMNPISLKEAEDIFDSVKNGFKNIEIVFCPPFVYIPALIKKANKGIKIGGQNVFYEEKGAYTGEVSSPMLKDLGCEYVIIGHSERRKYFNETDEAVNKKIKAALSSGLKPIFCVGETDNQRNSGDAEAVVERQIREGFKEVNESLIIAYEPVWAIGTGMACRPDDAKKMLKFIKSVIPSASILYGGSVNSQNSGEYIKEAGYDGLLVGGASLKPDEFLKIIKSSIHGKE